MYEELEFGVVVYWKYKEGVLNVWSGYDEKIMWLCKLLDW